MSTYLIERRIRENVGWAHARDIGRFWNEADLRTAICKEVEGIAHFSCPADLETQGRGTWVHSELHWQDQRGVLRFRPDISIFNPSTSRIVDEDGRITRFKNRLGVESRSKMMSFRGEAIAIEIKLCDLGLRQKKKRRGILNDYRKAVRILSDHPQTHVFVVYASRLDEDDILATNLPPTAFIHPIYLRGGVDLSRQR